MSEFIPPARRYVRLPDSLATKGGGVLRHARLVDATRDRRDAVGDDLIMSGAVHAMPSAIPIRPLQREAIGLAAQWNQGHDGQTRSTRGGATATRKPGVIAWRSALEWDSRCGYLRLDADRRGNETPFGLEFEAERHLEGHAARCFVHDRDPNSRLYLGHCVDRFYLGEGGEAAGILAGMHLDKALAIGGQAESVFPTHQQRQIAEGLRADCVDAQSPPLESPQGRGASLLDLARFGLWAAGFPHALEIEAVRYLPKAGEQHAVLLSTPWKRCHADPF